MKDTPPRPDLVRPAARDLVFLLDRGYPKGRSLGLVGDRFTLTRSERAVLDRGVLPRAVAAARLARRVATPRGSLLLVDGHNVLITIESALLGRQLLLANDGALRDIAGESARFRLKAATGEAARMLVSTLRADPPDEVRVYLDAPMSQSGELAAMLRDLLSGAGLRGAAFAVPVPEREILAACGVVASSDGTLLDAAPRWHDLARKAIEGAGGGAPAVDFGAL